MKLPENPGIPNILEVVKTPVSRKASAAALVEAALALAIHASRESRSGENRPFFARGNAGSVPPHMIA